jgi:hypothetical protein
MSTDDENLHRDQPPPSGPPAGPPGYGPPPYGQTPYCPPPYGQTPYGPPPYGQVPYGSPGYGPPPGYPPRGYGRPTNTTAILALVMTFVFAPAGLILGVVARRQIRRTGEDGDGLALAAIIAGGIFTAIFVLFIVFWIVAFAMLSGSSGTF